MSESERWLVTGASGLLGRSLCAHLVARGHEVVGVRHGHPVDVPGVEDLAVDLVGDVDLAGLVEQTSPTAVVHAAALTNVDACEQAEDVAHHLHVEVARQLAAATAGRGGRFVLVSTDHLWRGDAALVEEDEPPAPLNAYARTKADGEVAVLATDPTALVVRTNFFGQGPPWRQSFSDWIVSVLRSGEELTAFGDVWFTPIALPLLCAHLVDASTLGCSGRLHVAGGERLTKLDFAHRLASALDLPAEGIVATSIEDAALRAPRPRDMSLGCRRAEALLGTPMPTVAESIAAVYGTPAPTHRGPSVGRASNEAPEAR